MNHLTILSSAQVDRLKGEVDASVELYRASPEFPLPDGSTLLQTPIEAGSPPDLVVNPDRHTADDAENAVRIYKWLPDIDKTQAADPRLWTTLGLREFWRYMQQRWPVESASTVTSRYFVTGGRKALNRHGIARLWWGAALTYAPWEQSEQLTIFKSEDPARFTRVFFSQQQYAVDLMERNQGASLLLRTCVLAALEEVGPTVTQRDDLSQRVGKNLNLLLQTQQLEARLAEEARDTILRLVGDVADGLRAATTRA